ncbi:MAG TPA: hypothetical protein VFF28_00885 [Candidatus Nanoarchaeia archaeon]|nr:hypothetical protein [Candidatus Nanoarchaeia archaeon]
MLKSLNGDTILKLSFLFILLILLGYLIYKLFIIDETINLMINNRTFG